MSANVSAHLRKRTLAFRIDDLDAVLPGRLSRTAADRCGQDAGPVVPWLWAKRSPVMPNADLGMNKPSREAGFDVSQKEVAPLN